MPATKPFTNWVLPAPRSPVNAKTSPRDASRPCRKPTAIVSSTLFEMNITAGKFGKPGLARRASCVMANEPADSRERNVREFLPPARHERPGMIRRDGKEQLVIFAVRNRLLNCTTAVHRQGIFIDFEFHSTRARHSRQIGAESITQVHHGVHPKILREPARFGESRNELEMVAAERSAKATCDEQLVVRLSSTPTDPALLFDKASEADRNDRRTFDIAGLTADD